MQQPLVGRQQEMAVLNRAFQSDEPELVAITGRWGVGKTTLVHACLGEQIDFEMTGIAGGSNEEQLQHFADRLNFHLRPLVPIQQPRHWQAAFQMLMLYLESLPVTRKKVVFLDELPWLAGSKSDFLRALGQFWNNRAAQHAIVIVVSGSAAAWMMNNVVRNQGELHHRVTRHLHITPFTLSETALFLNNKGVDWSRFQMLQGYMVLGGVPLYLNAIEPGKTVAQCIDQICFTPQGLLRSELQRLLPMLSDKPDTCLLILRALANAWHGLSRSELLAKTGLSEGGNSSKMLEDLTHLDFITPFYAFGKKKKELRYRLTDEYTLFYLRYIEEKRFEGVGSWERLAQTQAWNHWIGYVFENICLMHVPALKKALGISGIYTESTLFYQKNSNDGKAIQIDLLIDRSDRAIHLFEIKFYPSPTLLTRDIAEGIQLKKMVFLSATGTRKQVLNTLITTFPVVANEHSRNNIDVQLDMNALFESAW